MIGSSAHSSEWCYSSERLLLGTATMTSYGASPGEGPRRGWHGNEDWNNDTERKMWEKVADGADTPLTRAEWFAKFRPDCMNTDLGEQRAQERERASPFLRSGEPKWPAWQRIRECTDAWVDTDPNNRATGLGFVHERPQEARGSDDEWTTISNSQANPLAALTDGRWDPFEVEAAKKSARVGIGIGMA